MLAIIGKIGTAGGTGHVIEYAGEAIRALSMEGRMTVCNMSIEGGARAGLIAPDEKTFAYLEGPAEGAEGRGLGCRRVRYWKTLQSDEGAHFDKEIRARRRAAAADRHLGHQPGGRRADHRRGARPSRPPPSEAKRASIARALDYMGLKAGEKITDIAIDRVFIGSCTNGRIEDLRAAAKSSKAGRSPGASTPWSCRARASSSNRPRPKASTRSSSQAGFEWREPGCSMCLAMNPDRLEPGERCASTSNRNFEGRQGFGGRTHLVSPAMAAAAAIAGHFVDIRHWNDEAGAPQVARKSAIG